MKRFYEAAEVIADGGGFAVVLDGKVVNTPARSHLTLPTAALAEAVAGEWRAQGAEIDPHAMRLTRLANTAIDRVGAGRAEVIGEVAAWAASDLLCYRAEAPPDLVQRQTDGWQPLLDWAGRRYGVRLAVTTGIAPIAQPPEALQALAAAVAAFDDFALAALHAATSASGSLVIGLALAEGEIDAESAWACSDVDESHQAGRWGDDDEAVRRRHRLRADILAAGWFLGLCRDGGR
jgi:chaperone required for assembly of F1-ATPase